MAFEVINIGATNLTSADFIRRNALPIFSRKPAWEALFASLGAGDEIVALNNQLAFDQLFLSTASEQYLDHIMSDRGFAKPKYLSLPADVLRELVIRLSAGKQTTDSLSGILGAVYGQDSSRTYITNTIPGPFNMTGEVWSFEVDKRAVTLTFVAADFVNILGVSLSELVNVINIKLALLGSMGFASTAITTHGECLRIYSGVVGVAGSISWSNATKPAMFQYNIATPYYLDEIVRNGSSFYVSVYDGVNTGNSTGNPTYWKQRSLWTLTDLHSVRSYITQVQNWDLYGYNLFSVSQPNSGGSAPIIVNTIIRAGKRPDASWPPASTWALVTDSTIDKSSDGGITWATKTLPVSSAACVAFGPRLVVGGDSYIATSDDQGDSWTQRTIGTISIYALHWDGTNFVAVSTDGKYSYSADGITWSSPATPGGTADIIKWRAISSGNSELIIIGTGLIGTASGGYYLSRSTDHGQTFSSPSVVHAVFPTSVSDAYSSSVMWTGTKWVFYGVVYDYDGLYTPPTNYQVYGYTASTGSGTWTRTTVQSAIPYEWPTAPRPLFAVWNGVSGRLHYPTSFPTNTEEYTFDAAGTLTSDGVSLDALNVFPLSSSFGYADTSSGFYSRSISGWTYKGTLPTVGSVIDINVVTGGTGGNTTLGNLLYPDLGLYGGYDFPAGASTAFAGEYFAFSSTDIGVNYIMSVYIRMADLSVPVVGTTITSGDFSIVINDVIGTGAVITSVGDNIYRVSARSTISAATSLLSGIHRYPGQSGKAFTITGLQLIKYNDGPGEYIKTFGSSIATPIIAVHASPSLQVTLPITPVAISRTKFTGAYLQVGDETPPDDLGTLPGGGAAVGIDRATYFATAKAASPTSAGYGPYLWDSNSVLIDYTNNSATLTTGIAKYGSYTSLTLGGTYSWLPQGQEFWVVIGANTVHQTQPIRVINRSGAVLWTDGTYQFQAAITGGTTIVNLVANRDSGVPVNPQDVGSCYITGTSTGQAETIALLNSTKAAGIPVTYSIAYPGDRGLAGEGGAISGPPKLSDKIWVWGSDNPTTDWIEALNG
jgi:hypothetical protein